MLNYIFGREKVTRLEQKQKETEEYASNMQPLYIDVQSQCDIHVDFMIDAPRSLVYIVGVPHKSACWDTMPFAPGVKQPSAIVHVTPLTFSQINLPHTLLPISLCGATSVHAARGWHNIPPAGQCICSTHFRCMTD